LSCATGKRAPLDTPRQIDARAAAADDAVDDSAGAGAAFDAAVEEVETASRGSTPPPQSQTLADHLAVLSARGEPIPGIGDDEILVAPADGKDDALNVEASAEAQARVQRSKKQSTIVKAETPKTPKTAPKRKQATAQTDSDSDSVQPKKRPKTKPQVVTVDTDSEVEEKPNQSRHKSVKSSDIYKSWEQRVPDLRQRFQLLILVRDGFPCKTSKNHQELNYKLVLQAARDTMDAANYKRFKTDMDAAFNSTDRE
jgi:hypothetical protein